MTPGEEQGPRGERDALLDEVRGEADPPAVAVHALPVLGHEVEEALAVGRDPDPIEDREGRGADPLDLLRREHVQAYPVREAADGRGLVHRRNDTRADHPTRPAAYWTCTAPTRRRTP